MFARLPNRKTILITIYYSIPCALSFCRFFFLEPYFLWNSLYFLDPYFRLSMLGAMGWLSFGVVPRATALFVRLEGETDKRWGLDGFNVYDKKAIFLFSAFGLGFLSYLAWAILSGSIDCFAGKNRTCHEIYNSIADPGEFWVTVLVYYFVSIIPTIVPFMGVQLRRDRE